MKKLLRYSVMAIAILAMSGCAGKRGKKGAPGANGRNGNNNNRNVENQIDNAQDQLDDLQDQLNNVLNGLQNGQLANLLGQQGQQNPLIPGQVNPGDVPPTVPLPSTPPLPSVGPSPSPGVGADDSAAPLRAVRQVQGAFRFRAPTDTHGGAPPDERTAATDDGPVVRRRLD